MKEDSKKSAAQNNESKAAVANHVANIQEDNQARPLDKIEGHMNNGETGGANGDVDEDATPDASR